MLIIITYVFILLIYIHFRIFQFIEFFLEILNILKYSHLPIKSGSYNKVVQNMLIIFFSILFRYRNGRITCRGNL